MHRYMNHKEARTTMNYNLNQDIDKTGQKKSIYASLRRLIDLIGEEKRNLILAFLAIMTNATLSLLGPYLIGYTIDHYVQTKQYHGVLLFSGLVLVEKIDRQLL